MTDAVAVGALLLRLVAGTIFLVQGWRKVLEPADAPHGRGDLEALIRRRSLPWPDLLALAVGWTELLGGAALVAGVLTRVVTVPLAAVLLVAIFGYKWQQGFLGGWDWPFSVLGIVLAIALIGPGPVSLDGLFQLPLS